jgi:hypothetical protein
VEPLSPALALPAPGRGFRALRAPRAW